MQYNKQIKKIYMTIINTRRKNNNSKKQNYSCSVRQASKGEGGYTVCMGEVRGDTESRKGRLLYEKKKNNKNQQQQQQQQKKQQQQRKNNRRQALRSFSSFYYAACLTHFLSSGQMILWRILNLDSASVIFCYLSHIGRSFMMFLPGFSDSDRI